MTVPRILVADDEEYVRAFFRGILKPESYRLRLASDGQETLDLWSREEFDLIIMDIRMTGLDGMEVLERIRSSDTETMVIMVSAYGDMDSVIDAMKLGANDFFTKTVAAAAGDDVRWLVLNMEANVEVDSTGLDALGEIVRFLRGRGVHVALARVKNDLLIPMRRYGTAALIGEENMYPTLPAAVLAYKRDPDTPKIKIPNRKLKSAEPLRSAEPVAARPRYRWSRRAYGAQEPLAPSTEH